MLEFTLAADMGSGETRIAARNGIVSEESRAALDPANARRVIAFGKKAGYAAEANMVYPLRGGISDPELASVMLRRFALDMLKRRSLFGVSLRLAVPLSESPVVLSSALEVGRRAGFSAVRIFDSMISGAIGAGVDTEGEKAVMTVDIGRDRMNLLAAANGGAILERTARIGSTVFDRRIQAHFAMEHGMLLSFHAAEELKKSLGRPNVRVHGKELSTGRPLMRAFRSSSVRAALEPAVRLVSAEIAKAMEELSPDAAADLIDTGIVLIGGGALQYGLAESLTDALGVPVVTAPNAKTAVIFGMQTEMRRGRRRTGREA